MNHLLDCTKCLTRLPHKYSPCFRRQILVMFRGFQAKDRHRIVCVGGRDVVRGRSRDSVPLRRVLCRVGVSRIDRTFPRTEIGPHDYWTAQA